MRARARATPTMYGVTCRLSLRETAERGPGCVRLVCETGLKRERHLQATKMCVVWCEKSCSAGRGRMPLSLKLRYKSRVVCAGIWDTQFLIHCRASSCNALRPPSIAHHKFFDDLVSSLSSELVGLLHDVQLQSVHLHLRTDAPTPAARPLRASHIRPATSPSPHLASWRCLALWQPPRCAGCNPRAALARLCHRLNRPSPHVRPGLHAHQYSGTPRGRCRGGALAAPPRRQHFDAAASA